MIALLQWTALLGAGWAAHGLIRHRHPRARLILWRSLLGFGLILPLWHFLRLPQLEVPAPAALTSIAGAPDLGPALAAGPSLASRHLAESFPWRNLFLLAWIFGFGLQAFNLFRLQVRLGRLRREARIPDASVQRMARDIRARLGVKRPVRILVSDTSASPFVCGVLDPAIMVPAALVRSLAPSELAALLTHEIAHLRRRDLIWCAGWRWMSALAWFHPLVWKIPGAHTFACEEEADRLAAGQFEEDGAYAQVLAQLSLRVLALAPVETGLTLNGASQIARRLVRLRRMGAEHWKWAHSAAAYVLAGGLFFGISGWKLAKAAAVEPPPAVSAPAPLTIVETANDTPPPAPAETPKVSAKVAADLPAPSEAEGRAADRVARPSQIPISRHRAQPSTAGINTHRPHREKPPSAETTPVKVARRDSPPLQPTTAPSSAPAQIPVQPSLKPSFDDERWKPTLERLRQRWLLTDDQLGQVKELLMDNMRKIQDMRQYEMMTEPEKDARERELLKDSKTMLTALLREFVRENMPPISAGNTPYTGPAANNPGTARF